MKQLEEIISDKDLNLAWAFADFGTTPRREVLKYALLKAACGYVNGHTITAIAQELGLVGKSSMKGHTLTKKGKEYLYLCFEKTTTEAKHLCWSDTQGYPYCHKQCDSCKQLFHGLNNKIRNLPHNEKEI